MNRLFRRIRTFPVMPCHRERAIQASPLRNNGSAICDDLKRILLCGGPEVLYPQLEALIAAPDIALERRGEVRFPQSGEAFFA